MVIHGLFTDGVCCVTPELYPDGDQCKLDDSWAIAGNSLLATYGAALNVTFILVWLPDCDTTIGAFGC